MRGRALVTGILLVVAYVAVLAATAVLRDGGDRPLYDGFTPAPSYQWVDPPAFFAPGNRTPDVLDTTIELGPDGSPARGFASPDGQFVVNLGAGAIPLSAGATRVAVRIVPLAPADLPPVPNGLRANGNAYRVSMMYEPSGRPVPRFAAPATLTLQLPEVGRALFVSAGSARWNPAPADVRPGKELALDADFVAPGTYVGATNLPELVVPSGSSRRGLAVGITVAALAALLVAAAFVLARRRRRRGAVTSPRG